MTYKFHTRNYNKKLFFMLVKKPQGQYIIYVYQTTIKSYRLQYNIK